jgi:hypothetical protein
MKNLPIHSLPAARMAALTSQGARESRAARLDRIRERWHDHESGPGNGGCAVVAILLASLIGYAAVILF